MFSKNVKSPRAIPSQQYKSIEDLAYEVRAGIDVTPESMERASTPAHITIRIDGRGQTGQSDEHMYAVYKNLGTFSADDQISVTRRLVKENKFMDKEKVGIVGHSYGGYMTLMILGRDSGPDSVFKCGISSKMLWLLITFYLYIYLVTM